MYATGVVLAPVVVLSLALQERVVKRVTAAGAFAAAVREGFYSLSEVRDEWEELFGDAEELDHALRLSE